MAGTLKHLLDLEAKEGRVLWPFLSDCLEIGIIESPGPESLEMEMGAPVRQGVI
jgi:hypothetical protein